MTLPKGYREILVPCPAPCVARVPFFTWDGAESLPMKVRCPRCGRVMTHAEALAYEKRPAPSSPAGPAKGDGT